MTSAIAVPSNTLPAATRAPLDAALADLDARRREWAELPIRERLELLADLRRRLVAVAPRWVEVARRLEGISDPAGPYFGEEWLAGPYSVLRNVRLLEVALADLASGRAPEIPGPVSTRADGQVVARVFPRDGWDRALFPGITAEVWMEPGVDRGALAEHQAAAYRGGRSAAPARVALVLGAGNVTSIGPMDVLHRLFAEKHLVLYKVHPVQEALTPLFEEAFATFIERGYLRVVTGDAAVGAYLTTHPGIDDVHLTGSDRTYEAIVFGTGEEGRANKAAGRPVTDKPVTAELGNVSPVIVVPGPWSAADIDRHGENIASMLTNNAGYNCSAARVIVTHRDWSRRDDLLTAIRERLATSPTRTAYYPGATERCRRVLAEHAGAEAIGEPEEGHLPWVLVPDLDPEADDESLFREEAFCSVFAETGLAAPSVARFVDRAVEFANQSLWGNLAVTLIVHPDSLRDPETAAAVERAEAELAYGTVSINHWASVGYALAATPWGAYPGNTPEDIQSGVGWVHNPYLFDRPQKTVVRSPFRAWPKPPWFLSHRTAEDLNRVLTAFEGSRSPTRLASLFWHALRG